MGTMSRILIVSNFYPPEAIGGAEIVAARQARALSYAGHCVAVFAGGLPRAGLEAAAIEREQDHDGAFDVFRVGHVSLDAGENFFRPELGRHFAAVLAHFRPDIVHFHNVIGLGANLIPLAKAHARKVVVTLHDHWGFCFKNTRLRNNLDLCGDFEGCAACQPRMTTGIGPALPVRLRRDFVAWCLGHADAVISPSRYMAQVYNDAGLFAQTVQVISNGIDLDTLARSSRPVAVPILEERPLHFVCAAYLGKHKGILHLLEALERLHGQSEFTGRWQLTLAGHGDLAQKINMDNARGRFGTALTFAGRIERSAMFELLARADVVVLPSIWPENEPVTMLEAIASGKAQIATRIGGNVELIRDGETGLLVPPGDGKALAEAMASLLRAPALVQQFKQANVARRREIDEAITIQQIRRLYDLPAAPHRDADFVVACVGQASHPQLDHLLSSFHVVEHHKRRVRLVWHDWLDADGWQNVKLLWSLPGTGLEAGAHVARAMRAGIPVLAEVSGPMAGLTQIYDLPPYSSLADALGTIAALSELPPDGPAHAETTLAASRWLSIFLPRAAFNLEAEKSI